MGKLLEFATSTEKPLRSRFGRWMLEVSKAVDAIVAGTVNVQSLLLPEQPSSPAAVPNAGIVFTQDVNGITELFFREDNGTVVQITSNGQTLSYQTQATWYLNATTGNDANDGATPATALLTPGELQRRFSGRVVPQNTTINAVGVFSQPFEFTNVVVLPGFLVSLVAEAPTVQYSGSLTGAFVPYAPAANTDAKVVDAARSFAADPQRRIRMTSGTQSGAITWIMKDLGANTARVGQFIRRTTGQMVAPTNGDSYVIETLNTQFESIYVDISGGGRFRATDCLFNLAVSNRMSVIAEGLNPLVTVVDTVPNDYAVLDGCRFTGAGTFGIVQTQLAFVGCSSVSALQFYFSRAVFFGHVGFNTIYSTDSANVIIAATSVIQGNQWGVFDGGIMTLIFDPTVAAASAGSFDSAIAPFDADRFGRFSTAFANTIYFGTSTATFGMRVRSGCQCVYFTKPTVTGSNPGVNDAQVGGTTRTWAQIPYLNGYDGATVGTGNGAAIVLRA